MDLLAALGFGSAPPPSVAQGAGGEGGADPSAFGLVFAAETQTRPAPAPDIAAASAMLRLFASDDGAQRPGEDYDGLRIDALPADFEASLIVTPPAEGDGQAAPAIDNAAPPPEGAEVGPEVALQADDGAAAPTQPTMASELPQKEPAETAPDLAPDAEPNQTPAAPTAIPRVTKSPIADAVISPAVAPDAEAERAAPQAETANPRDYNPHLWRYDEDEPHYPQIEDALAEPHYATAAAAPAAPAPDASDLLPEEPLAADVRMTALRESIGAIVEPAVADGARAAPANLAAPQGAPPLAAMTKEVAPEDALAQPARPASEPSAQAAMRTEAPPAPAAAAASAQVANQVLAAIRSERGLSRIEVRLDPPDLGRVQISFEFARDNVVVAVVASERADTLDLLRRHAGDLAAELQRAGFAGVQLEFAAHGEGAFAGGEGQDGSALTRAGDAPEREIVYLSWRDGARIDRLV